MEIATRNGFENEILHDQQARDYYTSGQNSKQ